MANLVIKPSAGGSLVFQDEGGTPAITIDASGNTTLKAMVSPAGFPSGHTINHQVQVHNTRTVLTSAGGWNSFFSFSYNKTVASSDIAVNAFIPGWNDHAGATTIGFRYVGTEVYCGHFTYSSTHFGVCAWITGVLTGHTTTGAQTLYIGWNTASGSAKPFQVFCPSSSDEGRLYQQVSTASVCEILN